MKVWNRIRQKSFADNNLAGQKGARSKSVIKSSKSWPGSPVCFVSQRHLGKLLNGLVTWSLLLFQNKMYIEDFCLRLRVTSFKDHKSSRPGINFKNKSLNSGIIWPPLTLLTSIYCHILTRLWTDQWSHTNGVLWTYTRNCHTSVLCMKNNYRSDWGRQTRGKLIVGDSQTKRAVALGLGDRRFKSSHYRSTSH